MSSFGLTISKQSAIRLGHFQTAGLYLILRKVKPSSSFRHQKTRSIDFFRTYARLTNEPIETPDTASACAKRIFLSTMDLSFRILVFCIMYVLGAMKTCLGNGKFIARHGLVWTGGLFFIGYLYRYKEASEIQQYYSLGLAKLYCINVFLSPVITWFYSATVYQLCNHTVYSSYCVSTQAYDTVPQIPKIPSITETLHSSLPHMVP